MTAPALSDEDRHVLDLAATITTGQAGARLSTIVANTTGSVTTYFQRLNQVLNDPAALAYNPVLVNRLRRLRRPAAWRPR